MMKKSNIFKLKGYFIVTLFLLVVIMFFFSPNKSFSTFIKKSGVKDASIINIKPDYAGEIVDDGAIVDSGVIPFIITINENEVELNNGEVFTIINTLSDNLTIDTNSITFYSGPGDILEDPELKNYTSLDDNRLSFQVPDNRNIIIKYNAVISGTGTFTNTVDFGDYEAISNEKVYVPDTNILDVESILNEDDSIISEGGVANFSITVNRNGSSINSGNPIVVMNDITNLQLDYNSFVVRDASSNQVLNNCSIDVLSNNEIKFIVPDGQDAIITYSAKVIGTSRPTTFQNVASWRNYKDAVREEVDYSSSNYWNTSINVFSYNGDPTQVLENTIYQILDSNKVPITGTDSNPLEYKTGSDGKVTIETNYYPLVLNSDTQYYLRRVSCSASNEVVDYPFIISSNSFDYDNHIYLSGDTILDRVVDDGKGTLSITKEIFGPVSKEEAEGALIFTIKKTDSNPICYVDKDGDLSQEEVYLTLGDFEEQLEYSAEEIGSLVASTSIELPPGSYLIEEVNTTIDGVEFNREASLTSTDVDVISGREVYSHLVDSYNTGKGTLHITKEIFGPVSEEAATGALVFEIKTYDDLGTLYYVDKDGDLSQDEVYLTLDDFEEQLEYSAETNSLIASTSIEVPPGNYLIEEVNTTIEGFNFIESYSATSTNVDVEDGDYLVHLIDYYTKKISLTISNQLKGDLADVDKEFEYRISDLNDDPEVVFGNITIGPYGRETYHDGHSEIASLDANGDFVFTLKHNEYVRINGLPSDDYTILQTTSDGYTTSYIDTDIYEVGGELEYGNYSGDPIQGREVYTNLDNHKDVRFINELKSEGGGVFTGVFTNIGFYITLLLSVSIIGVLFVISKKGTKIARKDKMICEEEII